MRRCGLALLLLATAGLGEGERVTLEFENASAQRVVTVLKTLGNVSIELDEEFAGRTVSLKLEQATVPEAVAAIAQALGGRVLADGAGTSRILPVWKHGLLERLGQTKVSADFEALPLGSVLEHLRSVTGANLILDPAPVARKPDQAVTLKARGLTARQVLDLALLPQELDWDLRYGVVFVSTPARLEELPVRLALAGLEPARTRVDLPFEATPLPQALNHLAAATGLRIAVHGPDREALEGIEVTARAFGLTASQALALALLPSGATAEKKGDGVVVRKR